MPAKGTGRWAPMIEAVLAMKLHDLLIWEVPKERLHTACSRISECRNSEFHVFCNWWDGKLFIVRVL